MRIWRKSLVTGILVILLFTLFPLNTFPTMEEAQLLIAKRLSVYIDLGYHFGTRYQQGILEKGKSEYVTLQLYKGNTYVFLAAGSNAASDVRIKVYDENFSLVADDDNKMNFSEITFTARRSGTYRIKTTLHNCSGNSAHWCYITGYK